MKELSEKRKLELLGRITQLAEMADIFDMQDSAESLIYFAEIVIHELVIGE